MASRTRPQPRTERQTKGRVVARSEQVSRKNDTEPNVSIGLMDIDAAVMYYFQEVIKPTVVDNGEQIKVPVMYANPERWKAAQVDGYIRDNKRQIIIPVVAFRRTGVEKDDSMPVDKLDANDPKLHYVFERKYTQKNRYSNFSVTQGALPQREYYKVVVPDYVTLNYECTLWTTYTEQMNRLVEKINYTDGSYWGEPGKFKFRSEVSGFDDASEYDDGERKIKMGFTLTVKGYLIPESFNDYITTTKAYSPKTTGISTSFKEKVALS